MVGRGRKASERSNIGRLGYGRREDSSDEVPGIKGSGFGGVLCVQAEKALVPDAGPAADPSSLVTEHPVSGVCVPKRSLPASRLRQSLFPHCFLLLNTSGPQ